MASVEVTGSVFGAVVTGSVTGKSDIIGSVPSAVSNVIPEVPTVFKGSVETVSHGALVLNRLQEVSKSIAANVREKKKKKRFISFYYSL